MSAGLLCRILLLKAIR